MPEFQNLKQFIDHLSYCKYCKKERDFRIQFGPENLFKIDFHSLSRDQLLIKTIYKYSTVSEDDLEDGQPFPCTKFNIQFTFNLELGTCNIIIDGPFQEVSKEKVTNKASSPDIYMFLMGVCLDCHSFAESNDITIDILNKEFSPFLLEREIYLLVGTEDKYHIEYDYRFLPHTMYLSKLEETNSPFKKYIHKVEFPIYSIDVSDEAKALARIKTLLTFS